MTKENLSDVAEKLYFTTACLNAGVSLKRANKLYTTYKRKQVFDIDDIEMAASSLFNLFEEHSIIKEGASLVSDVGLEEMSSFFGRVPEEERGDVFLTFLGMLYEVGASHDMQQFIQMEEVEEERDSKEKYADASQGE